MSSHARIIGVTMGPRAYHEFNIAQREKGQTPPFSYIVVVDPRISGDGCTAYFDKDLFRRRLKNQNKWDRRHSRSRKTNK